MKPFIGLNVDVHATDPVLMVGRRYVEAIKRAGGIPVPLLPVPDEDMDQLLETVQGVVLVGGLDYAPELYGEETDETIQPLHADRQEFDLRLVGKVLARKKPFLAVCGGLQLVTIGLGGSLIVDLEKWRAGTGDIHKPKKAPATDPKASTKPADYPHHPVKLLEGSRLSQSFGGVLRLDSVLSSHHQSINRLGLGMVVNAWAEDGVVEGAEVVDHPFGVGVQWHPEAHQDDSAPLFRALVEAAIR
jgi:putative glutamine amidotransferase